MGKSKVVPNGKNVHVLWGRGGKGLEVGGIGGREDIGGKGRE